MKALALGVLAMGLVACLDPIHDRDVSDLGDEAPGISQGPLHRAGQPCTTCHSGEGPANAVFSVAGTIYAVRGAGDVQPGATVTLTDAKGISNTFTTNEAGNFFALEKDYAPTFPLHATVEYGGEASRMLTRLGRDGGCASCHRGAGTASKMGAVYVRKL